MWYYLSAQHIHAYNETIKYLSTDQSIAIGERIHDFYLKYLRPYCGKTSPIPHFNPIEGYELSAGQRPKDMYQLLGKLDRHLIISPRLNDLLLEYKLSGHVIFDSVTMKNKINTRGDFKYVHFYENMWDHVDIESSTFCLHERNNYDTIELIHFESREIYDFEIKNKYVGNAKRISLIEAIIPKIESYDLFAFSDDVNLRLYISEKLFRRIKEDKYTGFRGSFLEEFIIGEQPLWPQKIKKNGI